MHCKMLRLVCFILLVSSVLCAPRVQTRTLATECTEEVCKLPDCRCADTGIPGGLTPEETPQFVMLTFDDAVTALNHDYYVKAIYDRVNPDGCPIGSTYYVSHEYTDYTKVHDLHAHGQEIALHSITHQNPTTYWEELDDEGLIDEFGGERDLLSYFADIPAEDIKGMRLPFLQLSGNNSFEVIQQLGLEYDCSWPTSAYVEPGLWPYSLEYKSVQDCPIGPCPDESLQGVWEIPMIDWLDSENVRCSMVDSCVNIPLTDEDELLQFFIDNFNKQYKNNKAPFGFYVHAAWFDANEIHFPAYLKFVDYLQSLDDVYIVNSKRVIDWIKNPESIKDGPLKAACEKTYEPTCEPITCQLYKGEEERWMSSCAKSCPAVYPWLKNPLGAKS